MIPDIKFFQSQSWQNGSCDYIDMHDSSDWWRASSHDDASLRTFFYEAMSIINSRPLTNDGVNDPKSREPLTPNYLLTMKTSVPLPPPGKCVAEDLFARRRWCRVQYLTEQFWSRRRKEYLTNVTLRECWHSSR